MNRNPTHNAHAFLTGETQFHLGFLPTEQPNPKTKNLDRAFQTSIDHGIRMLQIVDRDIVPMARQIFAGDAFKALCDAMTGAVRAGNRVFFSGCGATGRLSILLEAMWRSYFRRQNVAAPAVHAAIRRYENSVVSIMTGGDYALVRSVESFEDYEAFGRRQAGDLGIGPGDVLVAVTEGGETTSVLGTVDEAVVRGAAAFLLFNNPANLLSRHLERSRRAIQNPRVTVLDLHCGPMAVTGSTRMQATTSELLVAGTALEEVLHRLLPQDSPEETGTRCRFGNARERAADAFAALLDELETPAAVTAIADLIRLEEAVYRKGGLVTYYADHALLDIFTDTTERAPTFALPPFKKADDADAPPSWAFVKSPLRDTPATWEYLLGRKPRCLGWTATDYAAMGAAPKLVADPPRISAEELMKFRIGNEADLSRLSAGENAAVLVATPADVRDATLPALATAFTAVAAHYSRHMRVCIGGNAGDGYTCVPLRPQPSPLSLMERLAVKLVLNTVSTGTMVRMGRVTGNWMSFVEMTNKKLIDRSIRLISELCHVDYPKACQTLFETLAETEEQPGSRGNGLPPVQRAIARLRRQAAIPPAPHATGSHS